MANSVKALMAFFSTEEKKVSPKEMMDFWKSLSEEDREYYQNAALD
jgi:succinate dehydrogenase flavin-adding protein (antitoxin of CptAB toxin-antitoxin module)